MGAFLSSVTTWESVGASLIAAFLFLYIPWWWNNAGLPLFARGWVSRRQQEYSTWRQGVKVEELVWWQLVIVCLTYITAFLFGKWTGEALEFPWTLNEVCQWFRTGSNSIGGHDSPDRNSSKRRWLKHDSTLSERTEKVLESTHVYSGEFGARKRSQSEGTSEGVGPAAPQGDASQEAGGSDAGEAQRESPLHDRSSHTERGAQQRSVSRQGRDPITGVFEEGGWLALN